MFKKVEKIFSIESLGFPLKRQFSKEYDFKGESHNFTEIVYIESGEIEVVENENVYLMSGGDIIFHAPNEFHTIKSITNTSPVVFNLSAIFRGSVPDNIYKGVFCLSPDQQAKFSELFNIANSFIEGNASSSLAGQHAADSLSSFILDINSNKPINSFSSDVGALTYRRLVETMNSSLYLNLTLSEVAQKNHISISYLKVLFRRYANTCPKTFYDNLRANEAARLVLKGISIETIAEKMNFSSPNYFSVFFKKHFGITPSKYKAENKHQKA